jgi:SAM-dependent methyltransferase
MSKVTATVNQTASTEDFGFAALAEAKNYRRGLMEEFEPFLRGDVLEVGSGIGQMTQELAAVPAITSICALEPERKFFEMMTALNLKARCLCGTVADLEDSPAFDTMISVNVLEHIEDDFDELKRYKQRFKPGGHLCLFVPACPSIYAPIDQTFGHFRRYTYGELRKKLLAAGFQISRLHYYNSLGFFAWWLNFCVLKKMDVEISKVRFHDRVLFPVVHALEMKVMRPPFGQSLLAIARA